MKNYKKWLLLTVMSSILFGSANQIFAQNTTTLPSIIVSKSQKYVVLRPGYFYATMNGEAKKQYPVQVKFKYLSDNETSLGERIKIDFSIPNDPYVQNNQYNIDNTHMYNQDVFEIYISPCDVKEKNSTNCLAPKRYIELEISPNGAVFSGFIYNPNFHGDQNNLEYFDAKTKGIITTALKRKQAWEGSVIIPLSLVNSLPKDTDVTRVFNKYRMNLFCIISNIEHDTNIPDKKWYCTPQTCQYLAWSPTFSGDVPRFHRPNYFGLLSISQ